MKICITGARGFIGARLVASMDPSHELHLLTRGADRRRPDGAGIRWWQIDLTGDERALHDFVDGADILFHCAGELSRVDRMRALHVDGTRRLARAARGRIKRWVQLSSVGVYGPRRCGPVREDSTAAPVGEYESTKAQSDEIAMLAAREGAFSCTVLRPSIVFGNDMPNRSVYGLISAIDRGLFFYIGPPGACSPYIHVDNVVEALLRCGTSPQADGRIYNLSDDRDIEHFVGVIAQLLGRRAPTLRLPVGAARCIAATLGRLPWFPLTPSRVDALTCRARYPIDAIAGDMGYRHKVTVEDGLAQLVEAWRRAR